MYIIQTLPNWLSHTMDPTHPVVFVNTDKVHVYQWLAVQFLLYRFQVTRERLRDHMTKYTMN